MYAVVFCNSFFKKSNKLKKKSVLSKLNILWIVKYIHIC